MPYYQVPPMGYSPYDYSISASNSPASDERYNYYIPQYRSLEVSPDSRTPIKRNVRTALYSVPRVATWTVPAGHPSPTYYTFNYNYSSLPAARFNYTSTQDSHKKASTRRRSKRRGSVRSRKQRISVKASVNAFMKADDRYCDSSAEEQLFYIYSEPQAARKTSVKKTPKADNYFYFTQTAKTHKTNKPIRSRAGAQKRLTKLYRVRDAEEPSPTEILSLILTTIRELQLRTKLKRGLPGFVNGRKVSALADTGAGENIISEVYAKKLNLSIQPRTQSFQMGNSRHIQSIGTISLEWSFLGERSRKFPIDCHVLSECTYDLILGRGFLHATETLTKYKHRLRECIFHTRNLIQFDFLGNDSQRLRGRLENGTDVLALADSGAERNVMDYEFALSQGFSIDTSSRCCGHLQFADGTVQPTLGQVKTSWTFENGDAVFAVFEVLKNCIAHVVLGEEVLFQHNVFERHSISLVCEMIGSTHAELAPFDYLRKPDLLKEDQQKGPTLFDYLQKLNLSKKVKQMSLDANEQERQRQEHWNYEYDFGNKADFQERQAEARRRRDFNTRSNQQVPRIPALAASGGAMVDPKTARRLEWATGTTITQSVNPATQSGER